MTTYHTKEGDILNKICFDLYGFVRGVLEAVLEMNPFLAQFQTTLPASLIVTLPDFEVRPQRRVIRLWTAL